MNRASKHLADAAIEVFGRDPFLRFHLVHCVPGTLRFELGVGDTALAYLAEAMRRVEDVAGLIELEEGSRVFACRFWWFPSEGETLHGVLLRVVRWFRNAGVRVPLRGAVLTSEAESDGGHLCVVFLRARWKDRVIQRWLIELLTGGHDSPGMFFGLCLREGIGMHPYDDRGMDVFGPNTDALGRLYSERRGWLLDHDLSGANERYGASLGGGTTP